MREIGNYQVGVYPLFVGVCRVPLTERPNKKYQLIIPARVLFWGHMFFFYYLLFFDFCIIQNN